MAQHMSGPATLNGQVAFITGGSGGMGRAIAKVFKSAGASVVATDLAEQAEVGAGIEYRRCDVTSREPLVFDCGPARVRRLAVVTGAGADYLDDAAAAGADALLTGEAAERTMAQARESGLHLIAAGHYATETFGVRRLGRYLAERFDVREVFLDVPNPV